MILELLVIKGACGLAHWGIAHVSGAIAAMPHKQLLA